MRFGEEIRKEINPEQRSHDSPPQRQAGTVKHRARRMALKKLGGHARAAAIKAGKLAVASAARVGGAVIAVFKLPAILTILVVALVFVLFMGFLGGMPGEGIVAGVGITERGEELRQYAQGLTNSYNVADTWLVPGEGSHYPGRGTGHIGELVDRYGADRALELGWGDLYAPVLFLAALTADKDLMADDEWVKGQLASVADAIRPYFYYKESTVRVASTDADGNSSTTTYTVHLLVEAFTIRGHYQYGYEWVTESTSDGASITYERLADTTRLDDGQLYLQKCLEGLYGFGPEDPDAKIMTRTVFEGGEAFTEKAERMAWLLDGYGQVLTAPYLSGALIPPQFRSYLAEAEDLTGLPAWFLAGMIQVESTWDPEAVNPSSQCAGLMQASPAIWEYYAGVAGFDVESDRWNPRAQILVGALYLRNLVNEKGGGKSVDWDGGWRSDPVLHKALAHYGGYGRDVEKAGGYIDKVSGAAGAFRMRDALWPAPGNTVFTSSFHEVRAGGRLHQGVDLAGAEGDPLVAVAGGVVVAAYDHDGFGNYLYICTATYDFYYGHLSGYAVKNGDVVVPGQLVGYIGNTGRSSGPHLHFEVRPAGGGPGTAIDPIPFIMH